MPAIETRHLMTLTIAVASPLQEVGATPHGGRRIARVTGGTVEGRVSGRILDGGGDWLLARPDGSTTLDVRLTIEADDGALIYVSYRGVRHGPPEVMQRLAAGERVDPGSYYFRIAPSFETASEKYGWLNRIVAVGTGDRRPEGPVYDVFEVL